MKKSVMKILFFIYLISLVKSDYLDLGYFYRHNQADSYQASTINKTESQIVNQNLKDNTNQFGGWRSGSLINSNTNLNQNVWVNQNLWGNQNVWVNQNLWGNQNKNLWTNQNQPQPQLQIQNRNNNWWSNNIFNQFSNSAPQLQPRRNLQASTNDLVYGAYLPGYGNITQGLGYNLNNPIWKDKFNPLLTKFPYGYPITPAQLKARENAQYKGVVELFKSLNKNDSQSLASDYNARYMLSCDVLDEILLYRNSHLDELYSVLTFIQSTNDEIIDKYLKGVLRIIVGEHSRAAGKGIFINGDYTDVQGNGNIVFNSNSKNKVVRGDKILRLRHYEIYLNNIENLNKNISSIDSCIRFLPPDQ